MSFQSVESHLRCPDLKEKVGKLRWEKGWKWVEGGEGKVSKGERIDKCASWQAIEEFPSFNFISIKTYQ